MRVISHLSDQRRPRCRDQVLTGKFPMVPQEILQELEESDRMLRREALREGHTHPIAAGGALIEAGKKIGHVQM